MIRPLAKTLVLGLAMMLSIQASAFEKIKNYVPGTVIVKFKDDSERTLESMNELYNNIGVERVEYFGGEGSNFEQLFLDQETTVEEAIARLQKNPNVQYAQPNYILSIPSGEGFAKPTDGIPCIPGIIEPPLCDDGGGGGGNPPAPPGGGTLPCIPGIIEPPLCDPNAGGGTCIFPGIPFPPGCMDDPGSAPTRPDLKPMPGDTDPPVADPDLSKAWGLDKIQAADAWKIHKGSKDFIVAVIDTGVDYNHDDLAFNLWRNPKPTKNDMVGYDFIHDDGLPYDDQGHGSHTAGTVGAVGGNGTGVSGVAQRVSIMGLKFLSAQGSGETTGAIKAIDYAIEHGAKVMSNSWGGGADPNNQALYDAIERAKAADILFVAAAGNDNADNDKRPSYPAAFDNDNLVSVASTDKADGRSSFSNYGLKSVDLGAPGSDVYSLAPGGKYATHSGTSMACPHVAGAAALLWSLHPEWKYTKVKEVLMNTVDKLPALAGKTVTGGRLNVLKALQSTD